MLGHIFFRPSLPYRSQPDDWEAYDGYAREDSPSISPEALSLRFEAQQLAVKLDPQQAKALKVRWSDMPWWGRSGRDSFWQLDGLTWLDRYGGLYYECGHLLYGPHLVPHDLYRVSARKVADLRVTVGASLLAHQ